MKYSNIAALVFCAISTTGCGKIAGSLGFGISSETSNGASSNTNSETSDTLKISSSKDNSTTISMPVDVAIISALGGSADSRKKLMVNISDGQQPLRHHSTDEDVNPRVAISDAASMSMYRSFWPASTSRTDRACSGKSALAFCQSVEVAGCVINDVGTNIAVAAAAKVYSKLDDVRLAAEGVIQGLDSKKVSALYKSCQAWSDSLTERRVESGLPRWSVDDVTVALGQKSWTMTKGGVEWFGEGVWSGRKYEVKIASSANAGTESSESTRNGAGSESRTGTSTNVSAGK